MLKTCAMWVIILQAVLFVLAIVRNEISLSIHLLTLFTSAIGWGMYLTVAPDAEEESDKDFIPW